MKNYQLTTGNSLLLDFIRGTSAQLVVIGHGINIFGILPFMHPPNFPWIQNIAVLVFFLLSGFLITYSTIRKKLQPEGLLFSHYFIDRFSRIFTAFIPAILFVLAIDYVSILIAPTSYKFSSAFDLKTFIGNLLMLQDFPFFSSLFNTNITSFGSARPFWTLAVEWWIYMFFGYLLLVYFKSKKNNLFSILLLLLFSIVPLYNIVNGRGNGLSIYWFFGSLIYFVLSNKLLDKINKRAKTYSVYIVSFLAIARVFYTKKEYEPIFAFLLAIVLLIIIDLFKNVSINKFSSKIIRYNASYSYTLYLIHFSILFFVKTHFGQTYNPTYLFIIGFFASNLIAISIGYYTETILTKKVKNYLYNI